MVKENVMKQTEIGFLPEDWEVVKLSDIANVKTGPFGSALHEKDYVSDGVPIITVEHLGERGVLKSTYPMVSESDHKRLSNYILCKGDIVFSRVGSVDRNSLIKENEEGWLFSGRLLRIKPNRSIVNSKYLSFFFNQNSFKARILSVAVGQTMASLNTKILSDILVYLPPLPEQEAIAEALSDTDAWIESLEQLISKKRLTKQGTMQELLTAREGWEVKNIKEITNNIIDYRGVTPKKLGMEWGNGSIVALSAGNVKKGFIDFTSECYFGSEELYKRWMRNGNPKKNDIVFTLEAPLGNVALLPNDDKYILSQRTILLQLSKNYNPSFIFQILLSSKFQNYILGSATGSTAQGIKRQVFEKLLISVPKSLREQTRIAAILSDMDAEMEALEAELGKARKVKQGMMQELLTGRTRLI